MSALWDRPRGGRGARARERGASLPRDRSSGVRRGRLAGEHSGEMEGVTPAEPSEPLEERRREERRAVEEAGGGTAEGFELAEQELIEHTSHGDYHSPFRIMRDAGPGEETLDSVYGEADDEHRAD
jgi:hypothetical protein